MALKGKTYPVELSASRNPERKSTNIGLIVLRQDDWGTRNGETYLQLWDWDDLNTRTLPSSIYEGALDKQNLIVLARACCVMAGEVDLAKQLLSKYRETHQSGRGKNGKKD